MSTELATPGADERLEPPSGPAEVDRLRMLLSESFGIPAADYPTWFAQAGAENLRCYHAGGEIVGGLVVLRMGQFWGGRSVPASSVAGVTLSPTQRRAGMAARMLRAAMAELRAEQFPLLVGYPTSQRFYRRLGAEQAGGRFSLRAAVDSMPDGDRSLPMRAVRPSDLTAIGQLYSEVARTRPGWLDRGPYHWRRIQHPRGSTVFGYLAEEGSVLHGYVFLSRILEGATQELAITDWMARDERGWRRLLAFVKDQSSMARHVTWHGGADEPLLLWWDEQRFEVKQTDLWMMRIMDVRAALRLRGYPPGVTARLTLRVDDPLFPDNDGNHSLEVLGGEGDVVDGTDPDLRCGINALATLYAGHRSAFDLARLGALRGSPEAIALAQVLFSGSPPSMPDSF